MATSSIPLAKGLDLDKMEWPAFLPIKHDGEDKDEPNEDA